MKLSVACLLRNINPGRANRFVCLTTPQYVALLMIRSGYTKAVAPVVGTVYAVGRRDGDRGGGSDECHDSISF